MGLPYFASEFRELCKKAGLTRAELADLLDLSERTITRYENGQSRPSPIALKWIRHHTDEKRAQQRNKTSPFTFIDLFAGIGGMRRGFESIGGKCVFTCEWDENCQKTYRANFSVDHEIGGDIRDYSKDPDRIPGHDVLLAGFPCQPFSIAGVSKKNALGRPHGFLCDTQGTLFFDLAQIIARHRPHAFLLENVKNIERHNQGQTFATILNVLRNELGYNVHHRVISSESWVPQRRERIFIVGFRDKNDFDFSRLNISAEPNPTLGSILDPHDEVDPKYTLTPRLWSYLKDYKEKHTAKGNGFGYSLFKSEDVTRTLSQRYYKDGSEILIYQQRHRPRRLTPRECARLMGFDRPGRSDFTIPVSDTQAYRQFGNAVVVPVVEVVAKLMQPYLNVHRELRRTTRTQVDLPFPPLAAAGAHG